MLMEPIWESDFLDCSHGFRPGRRTMDCIAVFDDVQEIRYQGVVWPESYDLSTVADFLDAAAAGAHRGRKLLEHGDAVVDDLGAERPEASDGRRATRSGNPRTTSMAISSLRSRDGVAKSSHGPVVSNISALSSSCAAL